MEMKTGDIIIELEYTHHLRGGKLKGGKVKQTKWVVTDEVSKEFRDPYLILRTEDGYAQMSSFYINLDKFESYVTPLNTYHYGMYVKDGDLDKALPKFKKSIIKKMRTFIKRLNKDIDSLTLN